jgi:hypothetical protein
MMSDGIVEQMAKYGDHDEETSWEVFKKGYSRKLPEARIADLKMADQWLDVQTRPTREHASILTRKRELEAIHWTLRGVGR